MIFSFKKNKVLIYFILISLGLIISCSKKKVTGSEEDGFSFIATADMREYAGPEFQTPQYFLGTCLAIKNVGKGAFMLSPGDIDPPEYVRSTISSVLGADYIWYPVLGNHETETPADMVYLRAYNESGNELPYIVNMGPEKTKESMYSFDYENAHFVILNQYFDGNSDVGTDGDIPDVIYNWLADDLQSTDKSFVFVVGHEPGFPQPDMDNNRLRHENDSLNKYPQNRDRFWNLLRTEKITAYICGHTHNTSLVTIQDVVQLDVGHARGKGDSGALSTFIKVKVSVSDCGYEIYRENSSGGPYILKYTGSLTE